MHRILLAASACLFLAAPASAQDLLQQPEAPEAPVQDPTDGTNSQPDWGSGLVWGVGAGSVGIAVLAGVAWYLGVGGLRHIDRDNVLEHPMRRSLLECVESEPGVHLRELATRHGTAVTNTQWHLRKLEQAGLVKTEKVQGRRLYYPTKGGVAAKEEALQNAAVQNPNARKILEYLGGHAGTNQRGLAETLEMNPGTVRWHLRKMESAGLVRAVQKGAQTCYFPMHGGAGVARPERPSQRRAAVQER